VTRAPFRVSFAGGGTDLPAFYQKEFGAVVSASINKYVYIILNPRSRLFKSRLRFNPSAPNPFQYSVRVSYSKTEEVSKVEELQHPIVREALKFMKIEDPLDIATMADVPAGTGLGSSSTFTVALLHAFHVFKGEEVSQEQLAREAAHIEINILGRPVGKQDHYASAFGGLNFIRFLSDGQVTVEPVPLKDSSSFDVLSSLMLFYTGVMRDAGTILTEQKANTGKKFEDLLAMRAHALELQKMLTEGTGPKALGELLHQTWLRKRTLVSGISTSQIDEYYECARKEGAYGGKICGAGGGGFLMLVTDPQKKDSIRRKLSDLPDMSFAFEQKGSQVLLK